MQLVSVGASDYAGGAGSEVSWKGGRVVGLCLVACEAILPVLKD